MNRDFHIARAAAALLRKQGYSSAWVARALDVEPRTVNLWSQRDRQAATRNQAARKALAEIRA